ncbi:hypothetical protein HK096_006055 [Nowakowskiella sp. JEL0078]|nr:hypothetical protein HK096_006055 [Nowakowskiella sp. JEL0078]
MSNILPSIQVASSPLNLSLEDTISDSNNSYAESPSLGFRDDLYLTPLTAHNSANLDIESPPSKRRRSKRMNALHSTSSPEPSEISLQSSINPVTKYPQYMLAKKTKNQTIRPRWWNQTYLIFLVLRQAGHPLTRGELIPEALKLERLIASQRGLPLLFHGKTPQNTASAILTENRDQLFLGHKPKHKGEKWKFSLSYEPGNFDNAKRNYDIWMDTLANLYWPKKFGGSRRVIAKYDVPAYSDFTSCPKNTSVLSTETLILSDPNSSNFSDSANNLNFSSGLDEMKEIINNQMSEKLENDQSIIEYAGQLKEGETFEKIRLRFIVRDTIANYLPEGEYNQPELSQEDLNVILRPPVVKEYEVIFACENKIEDIPRSWKDIVDIRESNIVNAGRGLFAKRKIPKHTVIGYYFGVPMTEDEFDAIKDHVGMASHYSHRYRNTVLDATDDKGNPFLENNPSGLFCPFHFMNDSGSAANMMFLEGHLVNQIECVTSRDVVEGEELYANYGNEIEREKWKKNAETLGSVGSDEENRVYADECDEEMTNFVGEE